jgi:quercetin dioxygenase-like cupin family protein
MMKDRPRKAMIDIVDHKLINNSKTGQSIRFIQTGRDTAGEPLEMETTFRPFSKEPPPHYYPYQIEDFTVLSGELSVRMDGQVVTYRMNDSFHVPINKVHSMWNASSETTILNWKVRPASNTENLFETVSGLSNDGETNDEGVPRILQLVLLADKFSKVFRAAKPLYYIQKVLFLILTPVAYLLGYRASYKKYLD